SNRRQCLVASPSLLQEHEFPAVPAQLNGMPSLSLGSPQNEHSWTLYGPDQAQATVHHNPRFVTTDMTALRNSALAGVGIVQLPLLMVREHLNTGALVRIVPEWEPKPEIIHALFPSRRGLLPSVRALLDYLAKRYEEIDEE
ncbi:LysR family transcriptional regulator, partial [Alcaligenaceae bacterium 429]